MVPGGCDYSGNLRYPVLDLRATGIAGFWSPLAGRTGSFLPGKMGTEGNPKKGSFCRATDGHPKMPFDAGPYSIGEIPEVTGTGASFLIGPFGVSIVERLRQ